MTDFGTTLIDELRAVGSDAQPDKPDSGVIIDIKLNRVTIRLSRTGTTVPNVAVTGGLGGLGIGQTVNLIWFGNTPVVLNTGGSITGSAVSVPGVAPRMASTIDAYTKAQVDALLKAVQVKIDGKADINARPSYDWISATSGSIGGCAISDSSIASSNYSAGVSGWGIDRDGQAEFQNVRVRGEISSAVFKVNEVQSTAGTFGVFKSASTLMADCTSGSASFHLYAKDNAGAALFATGDVLRLKTTGADNWLTVSGSAAGAGFTDYTVTLSDGTPATFLAGQAIIDYGPAGQGFFAVSADGTLGASSRWVLAKHGGQPWSSGSAGIVTQVYADSDGSLKAGGGAISLSNDGIIIRPASAAYSLPSAISFYNSDANAPQSYIYAPGDPSWDALNGLCLSVQDPVGGTSTRNSFIQLLAESNTAGSAATQAYMRFIAAGKLGEARIVLTSPNASHAGYVSIGEMNTAVPPENYSGIGNSNLRVYDGLNVGTVTAVAGTGEIIATGDIETAAGINVGTATGAAAGQIKASGGVSQILPFSNYEGVAYNYTGAATLRPHIHSIQRAGTVIQWVQPYYVATTNSTSHYWVITLLDASGGAPFGTIDTRNSAANTWIRYDSGAISVSLTTSMKIIYTVIYKSGSPGGIYLPPPAMYFL